MRILQQNGLKSILSLVPKTPLLLLYSMQIINPWIWPRIFSLRPHQNCRIDSQSSHPTFSSFSTHWLLLKEKQGGSQSREKNLNRESKVVPGTRENFFPISTSGPISYPTLTTPTLIYSFLLVFRPILSFPRMRISQ